MINFLRNLFKKKKKVVEPYIAEKAEILKEQNFVWILYIDSAPVGYYKNPSRVAAAWDDLHKSKLYYHVNKYGTYKDDKYELICQKY